MYIAQYSIRRRPAHCRGVLDGDGGGGGDRDEKFTMRELPGNVLGAQTRPGA